MAKHRPRVWYTPVDIGNLILRQISREKNYAIRKLVQTVRGYEASHYTPYVGERIDSCVGDAIGKPVFVASVNVRDDEVTDTDGHSHCLSQCVDPFGWREVYLLPPEETQSLEVDDSVGIRPYKRNRPIHTVELPEDKEAEEFVEGKLQEAESALHELLGDEHDTTKDLGDPEGAEVEAHRRSPIEGMPLLARAGGDRCAQCDSPRREHYGTFANLDIVHDFVEPRIE